MKTFLFFPILFLFSTALSAKTIETNQVVVHNAPEWLSESRVRSVTAEVQGTLEWDIRRISVYYYGTPEAFNQVNTLGPVTAFARKKDQSVHLGPKVTQSNFDGVFGHELAHVIVFQKYQDAIPGWLDEGLANYVARHGTVDYELLSRQGGKVPVSRLTHAFAQGADYQYHYNASTAVVEMIAAKCSLTDLLQLSVGKKLETYLKTYCEIDDVDRAFGEWVKQKAGTKKARTGKSKRPWWQQEKVEKFWWQK